MKRIVIGISGASGPIYGVRLLEALQEHDDVETHLVMTGAAAATLRLETPEWTLEKVHALADVVHREGNIAASIASGSFLTEGMAVVPCSMKSLGSIAHSFCDTLLSRAADVTLKERRRLVIVPRETPLHLGHLRNLVAVAEMGAVVLPPMVAMYHQPKSVQEIVDHTVGKILDQFGLEHRLFERWTGP